MPAADVPDSRVADSGAADSGAAADSAAVSSAAPDTRAADPASPTAGTDYAERLNRIQGKWWKKLLPVQAPYHWNLRRFKLGRTLDVGCGNGRNLAVLPAGSVGVDHNPHLVATTRAAGLTAYTSGEFLADSQLSAPGSFDAILAAHLIEHLSAEDARAVMRSYLPCVRPGGRVLFITPQERGHASDPTHLDFTDFAALDRLCADLGLEVVRRRSFPFGRSWGKLFIYNEFNVLAAVPAVRD